MIVARRSGFASFYIVTLTSFSLLAALLAVSLRTHILNEALFYEEVRQQRFFDALSCLEMQRIKVISASASNAQQNVACTLQQPASQTLLRARIDPATLEYINLEEI